MSMRPRNILATFYRVRVSLCPRVIVPTYHLTEQSKSDVKTCHCAHVYTVPKYRCAQNCKRTDVPTDQCAHALSLTLTNPTPALSNPNLNLTLTNPDPKKA